MGFSPNSKVVVEQIDDQNWRVREEFTYQGNEETFTIPVGTETDFASIPRIFVWFVPRYGRYTKPAILHDILWREKASKGTMDWIDADGIFRRAMREENVPFLRRWIMWSAVRWVAFTKPRGRRRWFREAARVIVFTVPALMIVLPPALVIGLALVAYLVIETIVWIPLKLTEWLRRASGARSVKQVNPPTVSVKT